MNNSVNRTFSYYKHHKNIDVKLMPCGDLDGLLSILKKI